MILSGCQGKPKEELIIEECPECGEEIEFSSTEAMGECENCGHVMVNKRMECVFWCENAKDCVGEEVYEKVMAVSDRLVIDPDVIAKLSR